MPRRLGRPCRCYSGWYRLPPNPQRHHPRLAGYGYHTPGIYFVTVCSQHRLPLFGSVHEGRMRLSPGGTMVREARDEVAARHHGVGIDTVVMPDHVHTLILLADDPLRTLSLSDMPQRYKSLTTKRYAQGVQHQGWARFAGKLWQESFYDRVVRQDEELGAVPRYIMENPLQWELRRAGRGQDDEG